MAKFTIDVRGTVGVCPTDNDESNNENENALSRTHSVCPPPVYFMFRYDDRRMTNDSSRSQSYSNIIQIDDGARMTIFNRLRSSS
jgi:hypothetical protein